MSHLVGLLPRAVISSMSAASQSSHSLYVQLSPGDRRGGRHPLHRRPLPTNYPTPPPSGSPEGRCSTPRECLLNFHMASLLHAFNLGRGLWPGNKGESPPGQPCPPSPSHTPTGGAPPMSSTLAISSLKDAVISSSSQLFPTHAP